MVSLECKMHRGSERRDVCILDRQALTSCAHKPVDRFRDYESIAGTDGRPTCTDHRRGPCGFSVDGIEMDRLAITLILDLSIYNVIYGKT